MCFIFSYFAAKLSVLPISRIGTLSIALLPPVALGIALLPRLGRARRRPVAGSVDTLMASQKTSWTEPIVRAMISTLISMNGTRYD